MDKIKIEFGTPVLLGINEDNFVNVYAYGTLEKIFKRWQYLKNVDNRRFPKYFKGFVVCSYGSMPFQRYFSKRLMNNKNQFKIWDKEIDKNSDLEGGCPAR